MKRKQLLFLLALLMTAATGAWAQESETYAVKMKAGTEDAKNWTIASGQKSATGDAADGLTGLNRGDAVTLSYSGRLKVKSVTATTGPWSGDLSDLTAQSTEKFATATDGMTITGKLAANVKVSIAAGATVTLAGVTILGTNVDDAAHKHAGITCEGDATIILADDTENTVKGFYNTYPGIYVPSGKKLTIQGGSDGNGKLTASSNGYGAGIGGGYEIPCGDIEIQGGDITATGGYASAGIGGGSGSACGAITISGGTVTATGGNSGAGIGSGNGMFATCGAITISGGTVEATGGQYGAGIGSGFESACGTINIASTVTKVTAAKGTDAPYSIGEGGGQSSSCGTVTIGGTVYWQNNYAVDDDADTYLKQATIVYPNPFASVTAGDIRKMIGADGKVYDTAADATDAGTTAVAIIVYVGEPGSADASSSTYKGLALALDDGAMGAAWGNTGTCVTTLYSDRDNAKNDMNGIANTNKLVSDEHLGHDHFAARMARGHNGGTHPAGTSEWFLPSAGQWNIILNADIPDFILQSSSITGYTALSGDYWTSTEASESNAYYYQFDAGATSGVKNDTNHPVRACIAF